MKPGKTPVETVGIDWNCSKTRGTTARAEGPARRGQQQRHHPAIFYRFRGGGGVLEPVSEDFG